MAESAIILSVMIEAVAGREDELADKLKGLVGPTRSESGCLGYELNVSADKPGTFLFYEKFKDQAALDSHVSTPHFKEFLRYREGDDPIANQVVMKWSAAL